MKSYTVYHYGPLHRHVQSLHECKYTRRISKTDSQWLKYPKSPPGADMVRFPSFFFQGFPDFSLLMDYLILQNLFPTYQNSVSLALTNAKMYSRYFVFYRTLAFLKKACPKVHRERNNPAFWGCWSTPASF